QQFAASPRQEILPLPTHGYHLHGAAVRALFLENHLRATADHVGIQRSREPTVRRDQDHTDIAHLALHQQWMQHPAARGPRGAKTVVLIGVIASPAVLIGEAPSCGGSPRK